MTSTLHILRLHSNIQMTLRRTKEGGSNRTKLLHSEIKIFKCSGSPKRCI